jgi:hypothetical protein
MGAQDLWRGMGSIDAEDREMDFIPLGRAIRKIFMCDKQLCALHLYQHAMM